MKKDDAVYLRHMLECTKRIEENSAKGREGFNASHTLQDAILRNLQTLAESAQRLSTDLKATAPQVAWSKIAAFRSVLVHDYLGIDLELVWQIVKHDLPDLKNALSAMLDRRTSS